MGLADGSAWEKDFPPTSTKAILLNRDDREFVYSQLFARKMHLQDEMMEWAEQKNAKEILRVSSLINKIDDTLKKLIG